MDLNVSVGQCDQEYPNEEVISFVIAFVPLLEYSFYTEHNTIL